MSSLATPITGTPSIPRRSSRYSARNVCLRARSPVMPKATRASDVRVLTGGKLSLGSRARCLTPRAELLGQRHVLGRRAAVVAPGLEYAGQLVEPGFGDEHRTTLLAELALAHDRVPVAIGAEGHGGVVDVEGAEPVTPDPSGEFVDHLVQRVARPHVVARGEQVAGVQADAEALAAAGRLQQLGEFLERASERAAGPRRVFEEQRATLGLGQRLLDHLAGAL